MQPCNLHENRSSMAPVAQLICMWAALVDFYLLFSFPDKSVFILETCVLY